MIVLAFALSAVFIVLHLGDLPLLAPDEGRNAEVAREMADSGTWLVPTYDGMTYLDKPAFYFKTVALSFAAFGESEFTARLSSAGFALALLIAIFLFCQRVYDRRAALAAILVVASTPLYLAFARIVIFDMTLAFFVCSAIFACFLAEQSEDAERKRWYRLGALASGMATLVKGPVGFLLPTLVMAVFNPLDGRKGAMRRCFAPINWAIFFAVVLPWFVGLSILCPDFPYYGLVKESFARFTTQEFHRTAPFYYYGLIILSCFFPWSLLLPQSISAACRSQRHWTSADRLFMVWALVVVGFFSVSQSKLPGYILTAVIALGVLVGRVFSSALGNRLGRSACIVRRGAAALAVIMGVLALFAGGWLLNPSLVEGGLGLKERAVAMIKPQLPLLLVSLSVVVALSLAALRSNDPRLTFLGFVSVPLLLITINFPGIQRFVESRSSRNLAAAMPEDLGKDTDIACIECLPNGLPFYLKRLIYVITKDGTELTSNYILFEMHNDSKELQRIILMDQLDAWLGRHKAPVFLMANGKQRTLLGQIAARYGARVIPLPSGYAAALLPAAEAR